MRKIYLKQIEKLIKEGKTYAEIGDKFGVSRQRIEQIIHQKMRNGYQGEAVRAKAIYVGKNSFLVNGQEYEMCLFEEIKSRKSAVWLLQVEILWQQGGMRLSYDSFFKFIKDWSCIKNI